MTSHLTIPGSLEWDSPEVERLTIATLRYAGGKEHDVRYVSEVHYDAALAREAAFREELAGASRANHNCKVALKVANTNTKQILERESETVALKQRDLVEAQTAVTGWARKYDALQQRLTVAEQLLRDAKFLIEHSSYRICGASALIFGIEAALKPAEGEVS